MLNKQRKIVSVAAALSLIVAMGAGLVGKPVGAATDYGIASPVMNRNRVTTWDKVKFGSYYQTAEFETEPIKWRVLSVDGDDAFLLADECLDCKPYNTKEEDVTWETCSLREWLNEDFYNEAFSSSEQAAIRETKVVNEDNPEHGIPGGNDTMDCIYLLSSDEACNTKYGFVSDIRARTQTRESNNTGYAICNNAETNESGKGRWWLRSPGNRKKEKSNVDCDGYMYRSGYRSYDQVNFSNAVRPVLHLDLSSSVYSDAGEVDSEGNVTKKEDGISAPKTDSDGITTWDCVFFGNYKQKVLSREKEPIEWRVLSVIEDEAFLLAEKTLDCQLYNTEYEDVTWETCSLRKWLNEDFYNEAFSSSEQAAIKEKEVINNWPENNTTDRIYLPSESYVSGDIHGFLSGSAGDTARESNNTDYVKYKYYNVCNSDRGKSCWWLRSIDRSYNCPYIVSCDGTISVASASMKVGVRPVLHLDLSSSVWSKSGQVRSDGMEVPNPTPTPTITQTPSPAESPMLTPEAPNPTPTPSVGPPMPTPEETPLEPSPSITPTPSPAESPTLTPEMSNPTLSPSVGPPMPTPEETPLEPTPSITPTPEPSNPTPTPSVGPPMPTPEEIPLEPTPSITPTPEPSNPIPSPSVGSPMPTPEPSNPTPSLSITETPLPTSSPGKDADTVAPLFPNVNDANNGNNANSVFVWTGYNIRAEQLRIEDVQSVPDDFPKMKWKKNEYATGYEIYRSSKKASGYRKIQSLSSAQTVFSDKNTKRGARYYYKIRAVYQKDGVDVSGEWSKPMRLKRQYLSVPVIKLKRVKKGNKTAYVKLIVKRSQGKQIQIYFQKGKKKKIVRLRTNKIKRTYRLQYKAKVNHMTFYIRTYVKKGKRIYYSRFAVTRI